MHLPLPPKTITDENYTEPVEFYGKPLVFNPKSHRYYWDGRPVPSVTTIIGRLNKPLLIQWAADCAVEHIEDGINRAVASGAPLELLDFSPMLDGARKAHAVKRDTAGDIGTFVHKYARAMLAGGADRRELDHLTLPIDQAGRQALKAIDAFESWLRKHKVEPFALERRVFSREQMYAGTCDFYGAIDGRIGYLDFKTGNGVYDEAWWQLSGYEDALTEELHVRGHYRWVVHLNKNTGECEVHERGPEDNAADLMVWRGLVALDRALRQARKHPQPRRRAA